MRRHWSPTRRPARSGLADYGVQPGSRADLVVIAAANPAEAVAGHPERVLVLHDGRVVRPADHPS
ncbi:hypothetical protein A5792_16195 [Mycolicibacterium peregrinum]|uniref:Amidohydrolase 3 domain-containing protein n=1 Tax=Mycolicibacterium peregrinum TaxID=43304 RepID=A0A1A0RA41_MYCPR|nr:hypothetical protein [Mycolicibacterium peregrinum]OBB31365.1 hypothetical protein A5792_16195 [Mycolicibacterium peregrinum]